MFLNLVMISNLISFAMNSSLLPCLVIVYGLYFSQENLQQWLTDAKARDQFVIRAGSDTEVLWNDAKLLKPDPVYKRAVSEHYIPVSCII